MTQTSIVYVRPAGVCAPFVSQQHEKAAAAAAAATLLPRLLWFIDMKRGGQAPIIHEEPVQRQLGSVVRAGSINEWVCAVCARGVCVCVWVPGGDEGGVGERGKEGGARPRRRRAPRPPSRVDAL